MPYDLHADPDLHEIPVVKTETISEKLTRYATKWNVSREVMYKVVKCETAGTFDPTIKSGHPGEESYGLAQINLPSWPKITKAQAIDPDFALNFLAEKLSQGKGRLWTCYRMLSTGR